MSYQGIRRREGDEEGRWRNEVVAGSRHSRVRASCSLLVMLFNPWPRRWRRLDAEWISTKKDWQDAQRRTKEHRGSAAASQEHTTEPPEPRDPIVNGVVSGLPPELEGEAGAASKNAETSRDSAEYQPEMDEMRCILYAHGGMVLILRRLSV